MPSRLQGLPNRDRSKSFDRQHVFFFRLLALLASSSRFFPRYIFFRFFSRSSLTSRFSRFSLFSRFSRFWLLLLASRFFSLLRGSSRVTSSFASPSLSSCVSRFSLFSLLPAPLLFSLLLLCMAIAIREWRRRRFSPWGFSLRVTWASGMGQVQKGVLMFYLAGYSRLA